MAVFPWLTQNPWFSTINAQHTNTNSESPTSEPAVEHVRPTMHSSIATEFSAQTRPPEASDALPAAPTHEEVDASASERFWPTEAEMRTWEEIYMQEGLSGREGQKGTAVTPAELIAKVGTVLAKYIHNVLPTHLIYVPEMKILSRGDIQMKVQAPLEKKLRGVIAAGLPAHRDGWPYMLSRMVKEELAYAVLSHRWLYEGEPTFQDVSAFTWRWQLLFNGGPGYRKLSKFCDVARTLGCQWAWADTCCIDKTSSSELDEAIRSMYRWYRDAHICVVYLADTLVQEDMPQDAWFTRGWTLQELLASQCIKFYNRKWEQLAKGPNDKTLSSSGSLRPLLSKITGIPESDIQFFHPGVDNITERMSWAARRQTTRVEDIAYSLIGLFDVSLVTAYGEGARAFYRLQLAIMEKSNALDLLIWHGQRSAENSMFANAPRCFLGVMPRKYDIMLPFFYRVLYEGRRQVVNLRGLPARGSPTFSLTNAGLRVDLIVIDVYIFTLPADDMSVEPGEFGDGCIQWRHKAGVNGSDTTLQDDGSADSEAVAMTAFFSADDARIHEMRARGGESAAGKLLRCSIGVLDYAAGDGTGQPELSQEALVRRFMPGAVDGETDGPPEALQRLITNSLSRCVYAAVFLHEENAHSVAGRCLSRLGEAIAYVKRPATGWGTRAETVFIR